MAGKPETQDDEVIEYKPDFSLKEKIGKDVNMSDIFSKDAIEASQQVINKTQKDFLKWVENDLKTLENAYGAVIKNQAAGAENVDEIKRSAFSVKAQAGTFGFDLGSAVAKSLYDFCETQYQSDPNHLIIIRKHLDTLNTIFHKGVVGDGGKMGGAVHSALGKLIKKYT